MSQAATELLYPATRTLAKGAASVRPPQDIANGADQQRT
jgi:hypothetical protein